MPTLLEITELEDIVLFDSSANPACYLTEAIYNSMQYSELNRTLLLRAQSDLEQFLDFLQRENTFTVEGSLQDFRNVQSAISSKQRFLKGKRRRLGNINYLTLEHKKELIDITSSMIFKIAQLTRCKIFVPADAALYAQFQEASRYILQKSGIGIQLSHKNAELYASALYLSISENKRVGLVVNGIKFGQGLEIVANCMSSVPDSPLRRYPITRYSNFRGNGFEVTCTTKNEKPAQAVNT